MTMSYVILEKGTVKMVMCLCRHVLVLVLFMQRLDTRGSL